MSQCLISLSTRLLLFDSNILLQTPVSPLSKGLSLPGLLVFVALRQGVVLSKRPCPLPRQALLPLRVPLPFPQSCPVQCGGKWRGLGNAREDEGCSQKHIQKPDSLTSCFSAIRQPSSRTVLASPRRANLRQTLAVSPPVPCFPPPAPLPAPQHALMRPACCAGLKEKEVRIGSKHFQSSEQQFCSHNNKLSPCPLLDFAGH